ncbi:MAG: hypothetical protein FWB77_05105 [Treponema sp.]|nr:hypothetical protein [Treponema sp.]
MTFNFEKLRTPPFLFIFYTAAAVLFVLIFRFIFPGVESPLPIYSRNWRLLQGLLEVFNLFPAIALSALVIPFGLASYEEHYQSFSDMFFKRLISSVITAICAVVIFCVIFFLALPMAKNYKDNLSYSADLYKLAKFNVQKNINDKDWVGASQFIAICDRIWYRSPELNSFRDEIAINLDAYVSGESEEKYLAREALSREWRDSDIVPLSEDQSPLNASQAIVMSRIAFDEMRYFDAHWLATLGTRLAVRGSAEAANAARLASEAWNIIASQAPNAIERRMHELYNLKLSGYQAMESGDWIRAFYIFQELLSYTPDDPDAKNFIVVSERNAKETAFFIDEMELSLGEILNGAIFSLPSGIGGGLPGRAVMRFGSLTSSADIAYGIGFEYIEFDQFMNPKISVASRYAKLAPIIIGEKHKVLVLTHALDRENKDNSYEGEWHLGSSVTGAIFLDISYEDFLLISSVRHGLTNLKMNELFNASKKLDNVGYVYQIFQAEILNRLGSALFFLPMAIIVIVVGWRYRAQAKPRYLFVFLLPILPIVFHGFVHLYRSISNTMGIWLVLSLGFSAALTVYIITLAVALFASLIILAAQHS